MATGGRRGARYYPLLAGSPAIDKGDDATCAAPALTWYLAEGSTVGGFNLFYLLQNPNADPGRKNSIRPLT